MKTYNVILFLFIALASCSKESASIVGEYTATDGIQSWEWRFDADGKVWEKIGDVGGCGEYWTKDGVFIVSSAVFRRLFKGELIGNADGFELRGETNVKLKKK